MKGAATALKTRDEDQLSRLRHVREPARNWLKILAQYREPDHTRSAVEIALTIIPFALFWLGAWAATSWSYWLSLILIVPAAGFLVRLFLIQHDCGHGAFFRDRSTNDWVGRCLGVLTMTPYADWKHSHAMHHAGSGNLERRGYGDIDTKTVSEYEALTPFQQLRYRVYRHPFTLLVAGPSYVYLIRNRFPTGLFNASRWVWMSTMGTNVGIAALYYGLYRVFGLDALLYIQLPIVVLAATVGIWLFYVQHQFEDTVWEHDSSWDRHDAALYGSSHYDLPPVLRWMTANIGIHHVHHLSSVIPFYRLPKVLEDHPRLTDVRRLTLRESLKCLDLKLWDEASKRLVSFEEARLSRCGAER